MAEGERTAKIDPKLLELMACPMTKGPLDYDPEKAELVSKSAMLAYPVRDGIPIMLPSEARSLRTDQPTPGSRRR